ncbi:ester cyclase [Nonomuraea sp. NPDC050783]|uniref:ester cyclase n=1 Tax=Nonomuraea sp. NPDC050783 TaxID=3154634 RepID=UPI0034673E44
MSERNKAAARTVFSVWNTGDLSRLDEIIAPDAVHHDPYDPHGSEGLAGLKKSIESSRRLYPDLHIHVEDQIAEGDRVATRWVAAMTRDGKPHRLAGITIDRFKADKIVEAWRSMDMLSLVRAEKADPPRHTDA